MYVRECVCSVHLEGMWLHNQYEPLPTPQYILVLRIALFTVNKLWNVISTNW